MLRAPRARTARAAIASAAALASSTIAACSLDFVVGANIGTDGGGDAGQSSPAACGGTAGPDMVRVGNDAGISFCIDATEVTGDQYRIFLEAGDKPSPDEQPACHDHDFNPHREDGGTAPLSTTTPVVYVDWCDAYVYCKWAHKRLCGSIGGGAASIDAGAQTNQWTFACSNGGALPYPYGPTYEASACTYSGAARPPKSSPACRGGFQALFDMSGNVDEWEDVCENKGCHTRGGSYLVGAPKDTTCSSNSFGGPNEAYEDTGFRCCSDP